MKVQMLTAIVILRIRQISFEQKTVTFEVQNILHDQKFYKIPALGDRIALNTKDMNCEGVIADFDFYGANHLKVMQGASPIQDHIFKFEDFAAELKDKNVTYCINATISRLKKIAIFPSQETGAVDFCTDKDGENWCFALSEKR